MRRGRGWLVSLLFMLLCPFGFISGSLYVLPKVAWVALAMAVILAAIWLVIWLLKRYWYERY